MLNSIGLENVGLEAFRHREAAEARERADRDRRERRRRDAGRARAAACARSRPRRAPRYEINFSCPNVAEGGARYWADARRLETHDAAAAHAHARGRSSPSSRPTSPTPRELARACEAGGADAVIAGEHVRRHGDRPRAPALRARPADAAGSRARRSSRWRWRRCCEVSGAVTIPVIGMGGIVTGRDALEFLVAGAAGRAGRHRELRRARRAGARRRRASPRGAPPTASRALSRSLARTVAGRRGAQAATRARSGAWTVTRPGIARARRAGWATRDALVTRSATRSEFYKVGLELFAADGPGGRARARGARPARVPRPQAPRHPEHRRGRRARGRRASAPSC